MGGELTLRLKCVFLYTALRVHLSPVRGKPVLLLHLGAQHVARLE